MFTKKIIRSRLNSEKACQYSVQTFSFRRNLANLEHMVGLDHLLLGSRIRIHLTHRCLTLCCVVLCRYKPLLRADHSSQGVLLTVPWLRSLVAGLSPRRPGFTPGSIHVGFVVEKVALGQVFLWVLRFSPVIIIPPSLSKLISSGECVIC
jgi:hypothetical protein